MYGPGSAERSPEKASVCGRPGFTKHQLKVLLGAVQQLYLIPQGCAIHVHIYTPGDGQYCKWTTRKIRVEAHLCVRRSVRSSLTTGKGTHAFPHGERVPRRRERPAERPALLPHSPHLTHGLSQANTQRRSLTPAAALAGTAAPPRLPHSASALQRPFFPPCPRASRQFSRTPGAASASLCHTHGSHPLPVSPGAAARLTPAPAALRRREGYGDRTGARGRAPPALSRLPLRRVPAASRERWPRSRERPLRACALPAGAG